QRSRSLRRGPPTPRGVPPRHGLRFASPRNVRVPEDGRRPELSFASVLSCRAPMLPPPRRIGIGCGLQGETPRRAPRRTRLGPNETGGPMFAKTLGRIALIAILLLAVSGVAQAGQWPHERDGIVLGFGLGAGTGGLDY